MRYLKNSNSGFTLVEVLVAIALTIAVIAITTDHTPFVALQSFTVSTDLGSDIGLFQSTLINFQNALGTYPTGLGDPTYVTAYLNPPPAPIGFDQSYGTSGFILAQSGLPSPNNGYYLCARAFVSGASSAVYQGIKTTGARLSSSQYCWNTSCPATTTMADPVGAATVYPTYWFKRN